MCDEIAVLEARHKELSEALQDPSIRKERACAAIDEMAEIETAVQRHYGNLCSAQDALAVLAEELGSQNEKAWQAMGWRGWNDVAGDDSVPFEMRMEATRRLINMDTVGDAKLCAKYGEAL
jgi:hypothetical protein